jgi:galactose mutarotase-like enzyme
MNSTIHNDFIAIDIDTKGAELMSIKSIKDGLEYLWQADPKVWSRHAPILFPIVGRLKQGRTIIEGETYSMGQHGFARDLEFQIIGKTSESISYELLYNEETLKKYPYKFNLLVEYTLMENKLEVSYKVKNIDDKIIYFSIGAHPGFSCPLFENEKFEDYFLQFSSKEDADIYLLEDGMFSGEKAPHLKEDTIIPITRELFINDALVYEKLNSSSISINSRKHQRGIKVNFEGFPYLGIWSRPQGDGDFVCIEPWFGLSDFKDSDGIYKNKRGMLSLEEGKCFECKFVIEIS